MRDECAMWMNGTGATFRDGHTKSANDGGFTSQGRQDRAVYETLFKSLRGPQGVYVDLASNHYKRISNTYFFDKCLGWRGVCFEPNPIYHRDIQKHRSCNLVKTCVSDSTARQLMILPKDQWMGGLGGIGGGKLADYRSSRNLLTQQKRRTMQINMSCVLLGAELAKHSIRHVDFMSLDVEGHEAKVLRSVDLKNVRINHILCEDGCEMLTKLGYKKHVPKIMGHTGDIIYSHPAALEMLTSQPGGLESCVFPRKWKDTKATRGRVSYSSYATGSMVCS